MIITRKVLYFIAISILSFQGPFDVSAQAQGALTVLLANCQPGGSVSCKDDLYQKVWRRVEADNGEVTKIDMNSIERFNNGTIDVAVYTYTPNTMFEPQNLERLHFDCHGHFMRDNSIGALSDAPPRSVAGEIATIVCAGAKDTRIKDFYLDRSGGKGRSSSEYCAGFSPDSCRRISLVVESKVRPSFCKTGFALSGNGLTAEQLRICYVMTAPGFH